MKTIKLIFQELINTRINDRKDLDSFKRKMAKKYKIPCFKNIELLKIYHKLDQNKRRKLPKNIENLLRIRPIRSLSGIINVSVLTKPYPCPGKCIYCPSQKNIPKSYLDDEPAVQRAISANFDPYLQVQTRLKSLEKIGHPIDKIELRIIGGTWSYYLKQYQTWFIKKCFACANQYGKRNKTQIKTLKELQKRNEKTKCKIIGITIETRPDYINIKEIKRMRTLGITRVELGVQSIYNDVLKINKRGHNIESTINATKLLKNAGFKVSYQMMPNLLGSTFEKDIKMFEQLFSNSDFQPDLLKIYPLALVKQSALYKIYKKNKFKPYSKNKLIKLLIEIKKQIPYQCRIQRIIRDIPSKYIIEGGVKVSNLREVVQKEMQKQGLKCKCIRCREIKKEYNNKEKIYLFRKDYNASDGKEIFLSFENKKRDKLYALLRLRITTEKSYLPVLNEAGIVREIHTYGQMTPVGNKPLSSQHRGLGKKLMKKAEQIVKKEFKMNKIAVISGIGVRGYYKKLGYKLENTYMTKEI